MANDNNHIIYTAADIEKYHKGQLSAKQMHDMEKAAMDDPFLADALEGYGVAGVNAADDIADLKNRLKEKTGTAKLIPIESSRSRSFQLLRVAVLIAFIAGAGLLIYQLGFNKPRNQQMATLKEAKAPEKITDSPASTANATQPDTILKLNDGSVSTLKGEPSTFYNTTETPKESTPIVTLSPDKTTTEKTVTTYNFSPSAATGGTSPSTVVAPPVNTGLDKTNKPGTEDRLSKAPVSREVADFKVKPKDKDVLKDEEERNEALYRKSRAVQNQKEENFSTVGANTFRGQVTDNNRVGVPFANVTNPVDNVGTYTDARGYFNLTYPDSVLNVQVRSIGFENTNVQLRNNVTSNQVVLDNDQSSLSEVVVSKQKINSASRKRDSNMKLEEPEPADGWEKYDAYLLNNNNFQETAKDDKSNGTVLLSFEVNKNGEPTNIKVEKSLCEDCDKEAVRLIKQGPKWKRNAKKGRATITVPFQK